MYLTYQQSSGIAVITDKHPRKRSGELAEGVTVLSVERCPNMKAARKWFKRMKVERPWETRQ